MNLDHTATNKLAATIHGKTAHCAAEILENYWFSPAAAAAIVYQHTGGQPSRVTDTPCAIARSITEELAWAGRIDNA